MRELSCMLQSPPLCMYCQQVRHWASRTLGKRKKGQTLSKTQPFVPGDRQRRCCVVPASCLVGLVVLALFMSLGRRWATATETAT